MGGGPGRLPTLGSQQPQTCPRALSPSPRGTGPFTPASAASFSPEQGPLVLQPLREPPLSPLP